jgi:hypothetical protein
VDSFPDVAKKVPPAPKSISGETREQRLPVRSDVVIFVKFDPGEKEPLLLTVTDSAMLETKNAERQPGNLKRS